MQKYLVTYTYSVCGNTGAGRVFGTSDIKVSEQVILEWEKRIKGQYGFDQVAINNFVPLADD